jgi:hypothetical protein
MRRGVGRSRREVELHDTATLSPAVAVLWPRYLRLVVFGLRLLEGREGYAPAE